MILKNVVKWCFVPLIILMFFGCSPNKNQQQNALDEWIGEYQYEAYFSPAIPGGIGPYEGYTITIYQENASYFADVVADGWMLGINARAKVQGDESSIELVFLEYPDASMELFKEGDVILKFTRDGENTITKWISIAPGLGANKNAEGIYFTKVES